MQRLCKDFVIDESNNRVELHVNLISRIRDELGQWNYYSEEDIKDGIMVISGVKEVFLDTSGLMPNDQIYEVTAKKIDHDTYVFAIETSHVDEQAQSHDITIRVVGKEMFLVDPSNPSKKIKD